MIKFTESVFGFNLVADFGLYPRHLTGLIGVVTSPLVHSNYYHLFSNSVPLLFLGSITFIFYREIAFQVFFWVYLMTGVWVWAAARDSYHIGSSGLVYGFVCFLFFSGIFRKDVKLLALSLLVTFVYGGLVWGVLPLNDGVSWESHLLGSFAGIITAYHYRKEGPISHRYAWQDEDDEDNVEFEELKSDQKMEVEVKYMYRSNPEKDKNIDQQNTSRTSS